MRRLAFHELLLEPPIDIPVRLARPIVARDDTFNLSQFDLSGHIIDMIERNADTPSAVGQDRPRSCMMLPARKQVLKHIRASSLLQHHLRLLHGLLKMRLARFGVCCCGKATKAGQTKTYDGRYLQSPCPGLTSFSSIAVAGSRIIWATTSCRFTSARWRNVNTIAPTMATSRIRPASWKSRKYWS